MPNTMTLISSVTVGSGGAANITFNSIPQTYTDLKVMTSVRGTATGQSTGLSYRFNSSTTGISGRYASGAPGIGTESYAITYMYAGEVSGGTGTAGTFGNVEIYIPNYTTNQYKPSSVKGIQENNSTSGYLTFSCSTWANTGAVTSITLLPGAGNWAEYSTAYLYGINKS
jgi:hypothetical protein